MIEPPKPMAPDPPPEEALRLRVKPASPKRLNRKMLLGGSCLLGGVVVFALMSGLSERPDRVSAARAHEAPATATTPEELRALPSGYDAESLASAADEAPRDMFWGERGPPEGWEQPGLQPPENEFWAPAPAPPPQAPAPRPQMAGAEAPDPAAAPLFFEARHNGPRVGALAGTHLADQAIEGGGRREGFMANQQRSADVLDSPYLPPRSPFELQAGAVIPAALVTALNSDLPGRVIAHVTAPVYDSVSGDHLLIPQGARLIGTYDSANVYGDNRIYLVWNRIIMPNGWSIQLQGMEAADPTGAAGLSDRTDNHLDRLGGAIGLSAVLSILANEAEGDDNQSLTQSVGDAAAQEAARVGGRIIDRQLNVRPTLRVRPGAPVRVLVTRDIQLRPYRE
jgi:type IV secretory pathway VirB10-like protein